MIVDLIVLGVVIWGYRQLAGRISRLEDEVLRLHAGVNQTKSDLSEQIRKTRIDPGCWFAT